MGQRSIYIWKLKDVLDAEGSTARIVAKAQQASISALWIKVADGASRYANVKDNVGNALHDLVAKAHDKDIKVWGWQVPHCDSTTIAKKEGKLLGDLATEFGLDGMITDAEGTSAFFHGGLPEAKAYATAVRQAADMPASRLRSPATTFRRTSVAGRRNSRRSPRSATSTTRRPITAPVPAS